ncbi:MAG TPA: hypothetical protein VJZ76_24405 [Thermoanaerobaculia bacterium]|nr:hypothetical protein [Thermoanaerobaculia bacterium]
MARKTAIFARASTSWSEGVGSFSVVGAFSKEIVVIVFSNARLGVLLLFSNRVEERQSQCGVETRAPDVERVHRSLPFSIKSDERGRWAISVVLGFLFS